MASERDIKRIFISVEGDEARTIPADDRTEADVIREQFGKWISEIATEVSARPELTKLPGVSEPDELSSSDDDYEAEQQESTAETLAQLAEDSDSLPHISDTLEEANKLLQEIASSLADDDLPALPASSGSSSYTKSRSDEQDILNTLLAARGGGTASTVAQSAAAGGGAARGVEAGVTAGAGAAGAGGAGAGGAAAGAAGGAAAGAAAGPPGMVAGLLAGVAIGSAIDTLVEIGSQSLGVLQDIDEHLLSLADDIRMFSGEVQSAEAETEVRRLEAMLRRSEAIGPDVAEFLRERADLEIAITDLVTELESELVPVLTEMLQLFNTVAIPALQNIPRALEVLKAIYARVDPVMALLFGKLLSDDEEEPDEKTLAIMKQLDEMLQGIGLEHFGKPEKDTFKPAEGVFF